MFAISYNKRKNTRKVHHFPWQIKMHMKPQSLTNSRAPLPQIPPLKCERTRDNSSPLPNPINWIPARFPINRRSCYKWSPQRQKETFIKRFWHLLSNYKDHNCPAGELWPGDHWTHTYKPSLCNYGFFYRYRFEETWPYSPFCYYY